MSTPNEASQIAKHEKQAKAMAELAKLVTDNPDLLTPDSQCPNEYPRRHREE
jgi:hypothetical protein